MNTTTTSIPILGLNQREVAKSTGLSQKTIYNLTKAGEIPHARIGGRLVYPTDAVKAWLDEKAKSTTSTTPAEPKG